MSVEERLSKLPPYARVPPLYTFFLFLVWAQHDALGLEALFTV